MPYKSSFSKKGYDNSSILKIVDLTIHFDVFEGVRKVINGVNMEVNKGEAVALLGETGCGKTVLAKTILGILPIPPAKIVRGKIIFRGKNLLAISKKERYKIGREIAYIPQEPLSSLNPTFTIEEQMVDFILWRGIEKVDWVDYFTKRFKREIIRSAREKAIEILRAVNIPSPERVLKSYPFELSGGMRQRVLIAIALLSNPSFLIADEPGTALDVTTSKQVIDLLKSIIEERKLSVLYITHNLGVAKKISQRIYVMYAGEIVEVAEVKKIFKNPLHPYTQGLLDSVPKIVGSEFKGIRGVIPEYVNPPKGCRFNPRCDYASEKCRKVRPQLLEVENTHFVACHLYTR